MHIDRKFFFLFIVQLINFTLSTNLSKAQYSKYKYSIGCSYIKGATLVHTPKIANIKSYLTSIEFNFTSFSDGSKKWHKYYGLPRFGVAFQYTTYRENDILGKNFAIIPNFEFKIMRRKRQELTFRLGTGLGYFTKPFSYSSNTKNKALGSSFNASMELSFHYYYRIWKSLEGKIGIRLAHFSNGNIQEPNFGINSLNAFVGFNYLISKNGEDIKPKENSGSVPKRYEFQYLFSMGIKQSGYLSSKNFWTMVHSFGFFRKMAPISKLGVAIDVFYDDSVFEKSWQKQDTSMYHIKGIKRLDIGFKIAHELVAGKLSFLTQLGVYVYTPDPYKTLIFKKIGLKYHLTNFLFLAVILKTHYFDADFIEWGIGFKW